jgi:hypothetical protein
MTTSFRLMALATYSVPTSSRTKTWRVGESIAEMHPLAKAKANSIQTWTAPATSTAPSVTPSTMYADWVARSTQRRSKRSTREPAHALPSSRGVKVAVDVRASRNALWVRCSTSQDWATAWVVPPDADITCEKNHQRKDRTRMAGATVASRPNRFTATTMPRPATIPVRERKITGGDGRYGL